MKNFLATFAILICISQEGYAAWLVKQLVNSKGEIISVESFKKVDRKVDQPIILKDIQEQIGEHFATDANIRYQELLLPNEQFQPSNFKKALNLSDKISWPGSEVRTLVNQGTPKNRIDLTIVGDGYTADEKEKFFEDAERITADLFEGQTFASYLPLFNVHAVFVPSVESGLTDVQTKNTALGLYRTPKGSKRGILPGNTGAIERAIALAPDADYPILIANDDYYGGLGGRYAISTRSLTSGSMVLRHELGHNFGNVGEEYDGGQVYSGANSVRNANNITWRHWLDGALEIFETKFLTGDYVWQNLKDRPYRSTFNFPGAGYIFDMKISSVGWTTSQDVQLILNGQQRDLDGVWTVDRSFFRLQDTVELSQGSHQIEIKENIVDGDNVLAYANAYAYPENINTSLDYIGAYATFDINGSKSYRPNFETCLMRDMRSVNFCVVDQENMWIRFFNVVGLVDEVNVERGVKETIASLKSPSLDKLDIRWFKKLNNGQYELILRDSFELNVANSERGAYRVEVEFKTSEVRKPGTQFKTTKDFSI